MATATAPKKPATTTDLAGEISRLNDLVDKALKPTRNARAVAEAETVPAQVASDLERKRFGFNTFGEYTKAVQIAAQPGRQWDQRLMKAAASGLSEGSAADGGFLVPPEFATNIWTRVYSNDILSRCTKMTCSGNTLVIPAIDETSRVDGQRFGGILGYWLDEAQQLTGVKPKYRRLNLTLHKLAVFSFVTEELLSDSMVNLDQYLFGLFAGEIEFQLGASVIRGDGVGKGLGILNSPARIAAAAEIGQAASTILTENILNMWRRLWGPSQKNAVWLVNQDTWAQLALMTLGVGTGGVVTMMPPGGLSTSPYQTLLGRPVITTEFNSTLGTEGDIILVDLSQVFTLSKGAPDTEVSMHLRFDYDEMAFRVICRHDNRPIWHSALTPYQGSATQSYAVTLATRS